MHDCNKNDSAMFKDGMIADDTLLFVERDSETKVPKCF